MEREPITIYGAVEGIVDEQVLRRLIGHVGAIPGTIYGRNGKADLREKLRGYNKAAKDNCWAVLIDLDHDATCAPDFRKDCLPDLSPKMCFRIAVREIESWLMADYEHLAQFLAVPISRIPDAPEQLDDPKESMVNIARHSRKREIQKDMIPSVGSTRREGAAYASRLVEFIGHPDYGWRPEFASIRANSLKKCIECLQSLVDLSA